MKNKVHNGRFTAEAGEESFIVFIIGMRINRLLAFSKWIPTMKAMIPMIRELYTHPEMGFLEQEQFFSLRGTVLVQYWRSYEALEKYAKGELHLEAWRNFNRSIGTDGTVGIFHETYEVNRGQYEAVYGNMPLFGLAKATNHVPATGKRARSRSRMQHG